MTQQLISTASALAMTDELPQAQKDPSAEIAALDFTIKEKDETGLNEPDKPPDLSVEKQIETLYELIKSMEFYSSALCEQIAHTEKELAALKQRTVTPPPVTESGVGTEHSPVLERNLVRQDSTRRNLTRRSLTRRQWDLT